jgi:hypothetical protein
MTMPDERFRAVEYAREFLYELLDPKKTPKVPKEIRQRARSVLRHYPMEHEMILAAQQASDIFWTPAQFRQQFPNIKKAKMVYDTLTIDGFKLELTSTACPEQYDVFDANGDQVGYLRLRHGYFRADVPDCGGETVYEANAKGDGSFEADERMPELTNAVRAIAAAIRETKQESA